MAKVKSWVQSAKPILLAGFAIALLGLGLVMLGVKRGKIGSFSLGGYFLGMALPIALLAGVGLWGILNFDGLWSWIHRTLIPDGIFSVNDEIMRLFPLEMFASYLRPVGVTFGIGVAVIVALPFALSPLFRRRAHPVGQANQPDAGNRPAKRS